MIKNDIIFFLSWINYYFTMFKGFREFLYYAFALVISLGTAFGALVVFALVFLLGGFN